MTFSECEHMIWVLWCTEFDKRILYTSDCENCEHCKKDEKVKE